MLTPHTMSCVCTLFLTHGGAIQCIAIATGPRKYSYDLLQGLRARELLPYSYLLIYDTSNSLLTESMVDRDMLLGKELDPLNIL